MDVQIRYAKVSKEKIICEKFAVFKDCVYLCTAFPKKMHSGSGFSAVGSAHVWGARGRWFESSNPDQSKEDEFSLILFFYSVTTERSVIHRWTSAECGARFFNFPLTSFISSFQ